MEMNILEIGIVQFFLNLLVYFFIRQHFDKRLGRFEKKMDLEKRSFQYQLDRAMLKENKLFLERCEIVKTTYSSLVILYDSIVKSSASLQIYHSLSEEDRRREEENRVFHSAESLEKFNRFYRENRIYIEKETCEKIDSVLKMLGDTFYDYQLFKKFKKEGEVVVEIRDKIKENDLSLRNEIPQLLSLLEEDFRELLGIATNPISKN